jgi:5-methylcytosine-specific restriction endonuclease McrA
MYAYIWTNLAAAHASPSERDEIVALRDQAAIRLSTQQRSRAQRLAHQFQETGSMEEPRQDASTESPRRTIPKAVQTAVWRRDEGRCVDCGSKEQLEYDHIIPVSRGGGNTERNIQLLCETCNRSKGATI